MARSFPIKELRLIESVIVECQDGVSISSLEALLTPRLFPRLVRRTLQRRLARLIKDGLVVTEGKSTALVYKAAQLVVDVAKDSGTVKEEASDLQTNMRLSEEGSVIEEMMRAPLTQRRRTGYHYSFLSHYEPNVTYYLPESLRAELHEMGRSHLDKQASILDAIAIRELVSVDLSWASSWLEGNRYSHQETRNLLESGQAAAGKEARETQMVLNQKAAIQLLVNEPESLEVNSITIQNLHALLSQGLAKNPETCGRLRRRPVAIAATRYQPLAMPHAIEDCFKVLCDKVQAIVDPFELAFFLMVQLPYLHPFEQLNRQVSRMAANIPLIKHRLCPLSYIDLPMHTYMEGMLGVYELNRVELLRDVFVWSYEQSCHRYLASSTTIVDPDPLQIRYRKALHKAVRTVVRGLHTPTAEIVRELASAYAARDDRQAFFSMLEASLEHLHEGSVARYLLRRSEFLAWEPLRRAYQGHQH